MTSLLEIHSYVGVNGVCFGMSSAQVENKLGAASRVKTGFLGERTEYRQSNGMLVTYSRDTSEVVELGFSRNIGNLAFNGEEIFKQPPDIVLKKLAQIDGSSKFIMGFVVLLNLGMTLTGFHDGATEQKTVTLFTKGRWDDDISEMQAFDMNKL